MVQEEDKRNRRLKPNAYRASFPFLTEVLHQPRRDPRGLAAGSLPFVSLRILSGGGSEVRRSASVHIQPYLTQGPKETLRHLRITEMLNTNPYYSYTGENQEMNVKKWHSYRKEEYSVC